MKLRNEEKLKKEKPKKQLEYGLLRNRDLQEKYSIEVKNRYEALQVDDGGDGESDNAIEMEWIRLQTALTEAASGLIPEIKRKARKKRRNLDSPLETYNEMLLGSSIQ